MVLEKNNKKTFRIRSTYMDKSGSDYHDPQWMNYNEMNWSLIIIIVSA